MSVASSTVLTSVSWCSWFSASMPGWGSSSSSRGGPSPRGGDGARGGPGTTPTSIAIGRPTSSATASVAGGGP
eukprot:3600222-Pyramimonas_sp.AAC.1